MGGGGRAGWRAVPDVRAGVWGIPMAMSQVLSLAGMCALAAATYQLACWVGCQF